MRTATGMRHRSGTRCSGLRMRSWGGMSAPGMAAATSPATTSRVRLPRLGATESGYDAQHQRYGAHH
jgi:hypothetical protein